MKIPAILLALSLTSCAGSPVIVAAPSDCVTLLPPEWMKGVSGAPLPNGDTIGDWVAFGDAQTAQLDKANDRYISGMGIISRCDARDKAAVKHAKPKFLGIF